MVDLRHPKVEKLGPKYRSEVHFTPKNHPKISLKGE